MNSCIDGMGSVAGGACWIEGWRLPRRCQPRVRTCSSALTSISPWSFRRGPVLICFRQRPPGAIRHVCPAAMKSMTLPAVATCFAADACLVGRKGRSERRGILEFRGRRSEVRDQSEPPTSDLRPPTSDLRQRSGDVPVSVPNVATQSTGSPTWLGEWLDSQNKERLKKRDPGLLIRDMILAEYAR